MRFKTDGGVEYEVPEDDATAEKAPSEWRDPLGGQPLARVVLRLEEMLEEREAEVANCWEQRGHGAQERRALSQRLGAAERTMDELAAQVAKLESSPLRRSARGRRKPATRGRAKRAPRRTAGR